MTKAKTDARTELEAFLREEKGRLLAELGPCATDHFRSCGLILPTENASDAHIYALFPSVDYEETIENNQADILADYCGHVTAFRKPKLLL